MIADWITSGMCHRASDRMRKLAEKATPGPWRTHDTHLPLGGHTATILSGDDFDTELRAWLPTWSHEPWDETRNAWANAEHIAAWSPPPPALAAAALLEHAANEIATLPGGAPVSPLLIACVRMAEAFLRSQPGKLDDLDDIEARLAALTAERDGGESP